MSSVTFRDIVIVLGSGALIVVILAVILAACWFGYHGKVGMFRSGLEHIQKETQRRDRDTENLTRP